MEHSVRVVPRREPALAATGDGAPRGEPHRQVPGRMQVQRAANRPRLHERPPLPERLADVALRHPVDARRELELRRALHLRMDPAHVVRDHDELVGARAFREVRTSEAPPPQIVPVDVDRAASYASRIRSASAEFRRRS